MTNDDTSKELTIVDQTRNEIRKKLYEDFGEQAIDELQLAIDEADTSKDHRANAELILNYLGISPKTETQLRKEGASIATEALLGAFQGLAKVFGVEVQDCTEKLIKAQEIKSERVLKDVTEKKKKITKRKRKQLFGCEPCQYFPEKDNEMSNKNWEVFKTKPCPKCGNTMGPIVPKKFQKEEPESENPKEDDLCLKFLEAI